MTALTFAACLATPALCLMLAALRLKPVGMWSFGVRA
jgi:hypothetical protein